MITVMLSGGGIFTGLAVKIYISVQHPKVQTISVCRRTTLHLYASCNISLTLLPLHIFLLFCCTPRSRLLR
ncbi:hypothetical protein BJX99DRAFT_67415 [Aspergillus californicus]